MVLVWLLVKLQFQLFVYKSAALVKDFHCSFSPSECLSAVRGGSCPLCWKEAAFACLLCLSVLSLPAFLRQTFTQFYSCICFLSSLFAMFDLTVSFPSPDLTLFSVCRSLSYSSKLQLIFILWFSSSCANEIAPHQCWDASLYPSSSFPLPASPPFLFFFFWCVHMSSFMLVQLAAASWWQTEWDWMCEWLRPTRHFCNELFKSRCPLPDEYVCVLAEFVDASVRICLYVGVQYVLTFHSTRSESDVGGG